MATMTELAMVWEEVYTTDDYTKTWVGNNDKRVISGSFEFPFFDSEVGNSEHYHTLNVGDRPSYQYRCYCAARQLPRVKYSYCEGTDIQECANEKVESGWYPLEGITKISYNGQNKIQAFWRWAE